MSQIAIIGNGNVGKALAESFRRGGHEVRFGERTTESITAAAKNADAIVLAVPADAAIEALGSAGDVTGKLVIDCTNPLGWSDGPVRNAPPEGSNAARLQAKFPGAKVVKALNTMPAEVHRTAKVGARAVEAHYAGDDAGAKKLFAELAKSAGFVPVDVGPMRNAAHLESLAVLVIHLGTVGGLGRNIAFNLERA